MVSRVVSMGHYVKDFGLENNTSPGKDRPSMDSISAQAAWVVVIHL